VGTELIPLYVEGRSPAQGLQLVPTLGKRQVAARVVADAVKTSSVNFAPIFVGLRRANSNGTCRVPGHGGGGIQSQK
jgi:hypothetical protein